MNERISSYFGGGGFFPDRPKGKVYINKDELTLYILECVHRASEHTCASITHIVLLYNIKA